MKATFNIFPQINEFFLATLQFNSLQISGMADFATQFMSWFRMKMDIQANAGTSFNYWDHLKIKCEF